MFYSLFAISLVLIAINVQTASSLCGVPSEGVSLIFKGKTVNRGTWPWTVALMSMTNGQSKFYCAGVLVASKKV